MTTLLIGACRRFIPAATLLGALAASVSAQRSGPPRLAGVPLRSWQEHTEARGAGPDLRAIVVRNDTTVPMRIGRILLSNCVNLRVACEPFVPLRPVLGPGQMENAVTFMPAIGGAYSFAFEIEAAVATECMGPRPVRPMLAGDTARPAFAQQMVLPPLGGAGKLSGKPINPVWFVAADGTVDSVQIAATAEPAFVKKLRAAFMGYRFAPALDPWGCPVPGTSSMQFTFGQ